MRQDARSRVVAVLPGLCRETPKSHCFGLCTNPIRDRLPLVYLEIFFWAHPQIVDIRAKRISGFKHLLYSLFPYCPNYHHHHNHHFSLLNIIQLPLHFAEICPSISSSLIPSNTHTHTHIFRKGDAFSTFERVVSLHMFTQTPSLTLTFFGRI